LSEFTKVSSANADVNPNDEISMAAKIACLYNKKCPPIRRHYRLTHTVYPSIAQDDSIMNFIYLKLDTCQIKKLQK
jgi:hypothetical protein